MIQRFVKNHSNTVQINKKKKKEEKKLKKAIILGKHEVQGIHISLNNCCSKWTRLRLDSTVWGSNWKPSLLSSYRNSFKCVGHTHQSDKPHLPKRDSSRRKNVMIVAWQHHDGNIQENNFRNLLKKIRSKRKLKQAPFRQYALVKWSIAQQNRASGSDEKRERKAERGRGGCREK